MGGAVGTKALHNHLDKFPDHVRRVDWTNHDSFTTTSRVILPQLGWMADWLCSPFGGNLDAESSMSALIRRGVKITVLCHKLDPVIPEGARMAEFIEKFPQQKNIKVIYSLYYGHADLSSDMSKQLQRTN